MYLCYDIKGIQQLIFSVPRLKCMIGASGLIVEFDREFAEKGVLRGGELIFAGGGRGAFEFGSEQAAANWEEELVAAAHDRGLDIRIGSGTTLPEAFRHADRLYPYCPQMDADQVRLDEPCGLSGLWPLPRQREPGCPQDVHPHIGLRLRKALDDPLGGNFLHQLRDRDLLPDRLVTDDYALTFLRNVSPDPEEDSDENAVALAGQAALGSRNRWAVVAMDGNDLGRQSRAFETLHKSPDETRAWHRCMSRQLDQCTRSAFLTALGKAIAKWLDVAGDDFRKCTVPATDRQSKQRVVLPFRPLILGGDDVTILCHSACALSFVQEMAREFSRLSGEAAANAEIQPLWPATGELSISAGVLYAKSSFPLHMAIPYAEKLLENAKRAFRPEKGLPRPAAVDWDTITDTLVDTPAERRNRELRFFDEELDMEIQLTRRPYLLGAVEQEPNLGALLDLKSRLDRERLPPSVRARILPSLQRPWSERVRFVASVAKRHPILKEQLWEGDERPAAGWAPGDNDRVRVTGLPDALLLLEEEHRMDRPTAWR